MDSLPYKAVKGLKGLRLSPPGVVPRRDRQPRWIVHYSWWKVNQETLPLAPKEAMQFGHALDRLLRELLLADPNHSIPHMMKIDIADGFYRIPLNINNIPKLGSLFPVREREEPLVTFPLVLPMGWVNSPPAFCVATETSADIANAFIWSREEPKSHPLDDMASILMKTQADQGIQVPRI